MIDPQGVKSAHAEATGIMVTGTNYLKGAVFLSGGTAGDIVFRDGGASGSVITQFNIPANTNNTVAVNIPGAGILFTTNLHVTLPTGAKVTAYYGK